MRAVEFLDRSQLASGEFPVFTSLDRMMRGGCAPDPSVYPTALICQSLRYCPAARELKLRAEDFLLREMDEAGLWRHWTREHPHRHQLPPDVDDTSCASAALLAGGRDLPDNRDLLLANRSPGGLFYTWFAPRWRWTGRRHMALTLAQLRHAPTLFMFFRRTSAAPYDVDAVVNANALFHLAPFAGEEAVVSFLADILQRDREEQCDKWYDNRFVIWYFLARALAGRSAAAAAILARKLGEARPAGALERALAACACAAIGAPADEEGLSELIALQSPDGSWPRAALYHGGRARLRGGGFAAPHPDTPHWGSEALTTAFAIEALSRAASEAGS